jgi:hypothetical protein
VTKVDFPVCCFNTIKLSTFVDGHSTIEKFSNIYDVTLSRLCFFKNVAQKSELT